MKFKIDFSNLKLQALELLKSISPDLIKRGVKAIAAKFGIGLTGFQGIILWFAIKFGIKKADKIIEETKDAVVDHANEDKYKEIISDENSTDQDKINAELDLLNGNKP